MSTLLKRAHRVLLYVVAAIFGLSLLAPMATLASTGLVPGDQAVIDNPNGSGANLRSDYSVLDDTTILTEIAQGTTVSIGEGPFASDAATWFWVFGPDMQEGFVEASLLLPVAAEADLDAPVEEIQSEEPEAEEVADPIAVLPWQDPIEYGFVVDDNNELPAEGLAVRATATVDGEILGRIPATASLEVTEGRIWNGDQSFVRVNYADQGGYVNGSYIVLESEQASEPVVEVPTIEVPVVEVPTIEVPVIEVPTIEAPVVEIPEIDIPNVEAEVPVVEIPTIEVPVVEVPTIEAPVVEVPTVEVPVVEVPEIEVPTIEAPVIEVLTVEVPTVEVPAVEVPEIEVPIVEEATSVATEATDEMLDTATSVETEQSAVTEEATEEATGEPATPAAPEESAATEEATEEATAEAVETVEPVVTGEATPVATEEAVEPAVTVEATEEATAEVIETSAVPAVTAPASDVSKLIGSATVTGTNGDGIRCRVAPSDDAATLMVLDEGTTVSVLAEPVNGYLGIECGGLQGFADVNYMWSGGAGDEQLTSSDSTVVVTGTGNGLNCRTGAGLSYPVITVLYDGTTLKTRAAASNGWVAVVCGGQNGFVSTPYVELSGSTGSGSDSGSTGTGSSASGTATVSNTNGDGLRCRSGAGTSYSILTVLGPGAKVTVRGASQGSWTPIVCGGANGWVHNDYLTMGSTGSTPSPSNPAPAPGAATGTVTVANTGNAGLNCRSGASTGNPVITVLRAGQTVDTRDGSTNGWTAVVCGGQNGFVSSEYITGGSSSGSTPAPAPSDPAPTAPAPGGMSSGDHAKTTANVNLRYSASLGAGVSTVVPTGQVLLVTGNITSGFYPVDYDGLTGFMSGDYLSKTSDALSQRGGSASPGTTPPPTSGGSTATGNAMVDYAMQYLGYPYVWATHGPASFDCSGFTYWVAQNVLGINIGYGTWTQVSAGTPVSRDNLQPGDLVFFQNTYTAGLSHVGLYIGGGQFIHAQNESTGVVISDLDSSYYGPRWYGAVRL